MRRIDIILREILYFLFSIGLALTVVIKSHIVDNRIVPFEWISVFVILALGGVFYGCSRFLCKRIVTCVDKISSLRNIAHITECKRVAIGSFVLLFCSWLCYFITYFPGVSMVDNLWILESPIYAAKQHTLLYNIIFSSVFEMASGKFRSFNAGAAVFTLLQLVYCSGIVACLQAWLAKKRAPWIVLAIIQIWFMFSPNVVSIANTTVKDVLFSFSGMMLIPLLFDLYETDGSVIRNRYWIFVFCVSSIAVALLRNNGKYVILATAVIMLCVCHRRWKQITSIIMLAVVFPISADMALMKYTVKSEKDVVEALGVPIQQIARTVQQEGVITDEQWKVIDQIMPREEMREKYVPSSVDSLKWHTNTMNKAFIQENTDLFLKTWMQMLPDNLSNYIDAYILLTSGYWIPGVSDNSTQFYFDYPIIDSIRYKVTPVQLWPNSIQSIFEKYYRNVSTPCIGSLLWIILFFCIYCVYCKDWKKLIIFIPILANWGTVMISAPINHCFRYNYIMYLSFPILMYLTFRKRKIHCEDFQDY